MPANRSKVIIDILEEHFEELSFLWAQRMTALNSPVLTLRNLRDLEARIEAHVEGLLVGEEETIRLLEPRLKTQSSNDAFAAAYPLLRFGQSQATRAVWDTFSQSKGKALTGLCQALCACCPPEIKPLLAEIAAGAPSLGAAAALEVLAFCSPSDIKVGKVISFLNADTPPLCQAGWRIVALANLNVPSELYEKSLVNKDACVRQECLTAAAWTRQAWVLDYCRGVAAKDPPADFHPIQMLAILGQPNDLQRLLYLANNAALGPQRFEWLGAFGNPQSVDLIFGGFKSRNPREAIAAGSAFTRITGSDVSSATRIKLPPDGNNEPDAFEQEFLDEAFLPDLEMAQVYWQKVKTRFEKGTRWCRGYDRIQPETFPGINTFDMVSYYEILLNAKNLGTWQGTLADIKMPFKFKSGVSEAHRQ